MKQITFNDSWPTNWKQVYAKDLFIIYGELSNRGLAYQYDNRFKQTLALVNKVANPGAKILDLAGAQGNFSLSLAELGYKVTWNDLRQDLVDYIKLKYEYGDIDFKPGNIFELDFEDQFDVVLITEVIEHVAHPDEFLKKVSRLIKPEGHIIMSTPNGERFRNKLPKFSECSDPSQFENIQFKPDADGHIFLLYQDEVETIAKKSNLTVLETIYCTNFLTRGALKTEKLLRFIPRFIVDKLENFTRSLPLILRKKIHVGMVFLLGNNQDK